MTTYACCRAPKPLADRRAAERLLSTVGREQPILFRRSEDTAHFWFFGPQNIEIVLKVLDACNDFGHFWVFASGLTNVEVDLRVTDTQTGRQWTYSNPLSTEFQPVADTAAFTCP